MPIPPDPTSDSLRGDLAQLQQNGWTPQRLHQLKTLVKVSYALEREGDAVDRITKVLLSTIESLGSGLPLPEAAKLWYGLTDATRMLSSKERHTVAWKRFGEGALETFRTKRGPEIHDLVAQRLTEVYSEHNASLAASSSAEPSDRLVSSVTDQPSGRYAERAPSFRWPARRWPWLTLLVLLSGPVILFLVFRDSDTGAKAGTTSTATTSGATVNGRPYSLTAPANFPTVIRGSGTETLHARGHYGARRMIARSGLVIVQRDAGTIDIKLFPRPVSCALWYRGSPEGIDFEITVEANAQNLDAIPINKPLRQYHLGWTLHRGNTSSSQLFDESLSDGLGKPGSVTITAIDTSPGGFWRGRIDTQGSEASTGAKQNFKGTFAAQWCNIGTGLS